jgi:putative transcriptional regulator
VNNETRLNFVPFGSMIIPLLLILFWTAVPEGAFPWATREEQLSSRSFFFRPQQNPGSSMMSLSRGKFLVADRSIRDPRFAETVLLIVDYSSQGAMGIIINRPTKVRLSSAFPKIEGLKKRKDTIYIGGPVGIEQMFLLIRSMRTPEESLHLFADVSISSSEKILRAMAEGRKSGNSFRVYAGYAGWSPQQLDQEVMRGDWHVVQADSKTIFDKRPSEIWPELIRQSSKLWVRAGTEATYLQR